jgi:ATP-dependent Clp protease ATP-binding subunit ClpA
MDHGKLTDHNGKSVGFRNVVLIMTTNAGASDLAKAPMGFGAPSARATTQRPSTMFTPEFRNRLDAVITFASLPPRSSPRWWKFVFQLEAQLATAVSPSSCRGRSQVAGGNRL